MLYSKVIFVITKTGVNG